LDWCHHCGREDDVIFGDGERLVCRRCVNYYGDAAAHPEHAHPAFIRELLDMSGDVVDLVETKRGPRWRTKGQLA
jgi:hypothetical protein